MTKPDTVNGWRKKKVVDQLQKLMWSMRADITYHAAPGLAPDRAVFTLDYQREVFGEIAKAIETIKHFEVKPD